MPPGIDLAARGPPRSPPPPPLRGTRPRPPRRSARAPTRSPTGRPVTSTSTTGVPVATTARTSSSWTPGRSNEARSRNSPLVQSSVEPGLVAHDQHRDVGRAGQLDRPRRTRRATSRSRRIRGRTRPIGPNRCRIASTHRQAPATSTASTSVSVVERRRKRAPAAREHLAERLDVGRVAVVAEQVSGRVGVRADHRDEASSGREREDAVVLQEHDALPRDRARELAVRRACRRRRRPGPRRRRDRRTARARTWRRRTRRTASSTVCSLTRPTSRASRSGCAVAIGRRKLEVEPGADRHRRRLLAVGGEPVVRRPAAGSRSSRRRRSRRTPTPPAGSR